MTEVVIADTVTTIKSNAFEYINGTVEIPKSVVKVEENAFSDAKKFVIYGDVKGYETSALGYCNDTEVVLHGEAQDLGKALYINSGNVTVTIAGDNSKCKVSNGCLLSSDSKQLYYCINARDSVKIPDTVETISTSAFCGKYFKTLTLGTNVKTIGDFAFEYTGIKTITTNKKLTSVGTKAFYGTRIKNVNFSKNVKIGVAAFPKTATIKNLKKFKYSRTTLETAKLGKTNYNIKFAKVSGAKGYQVNVKKGKKTYKYFTTKNSYTKKAPGTLTKGYEAKKNYELKENAYLKNVTDAAYVTVRPYKNVKGKKSYGKWSEKMVLNSYK